MTAGTKLLVVDDDRMMLDFAARLLTSLGYDSVVVTDAEAALRVLEDDPDIRAIITDLRLGKAQNGADLIRTALELRPDIGGVLTSGDRATLHELADTVRDGVALLAKPYRRHDLADSLAQVV